MSDRSKFISSEDLPSQLLLTSLRNMRLFILWWK